PIRAPAIGGVWLVFSWQATCRPSSACGYARAAQVARRVPPVPAHRIDPGAHPMGLAVPERLSRIPHGETVDVDEITILFDGDDLPLQTDVPIPIPVEDGQADLRVQAHPLKPRSLRVHIYEDATVVPVVPGGHRHRKSVWPHRRDDGRIRLPQERFDLGWELQHGTIGLDDHGFGPGQEDSRCRAPDGTGRDQGGEASRA